MWWDRISEMTLPSETTFARFVVDQEKCTGCGRCVETCPIQLLALSDGKARSNERYDEFRCITCQNCAAVCPVGAVSIEGDYRVHSGFWKNEDLYQGGKTLPEPLGPSGKRPFEDLEKDLTETERVIYRRRSVRLYKKKQVEPALVRRVIEAGRFAPSAGNNQPWKFVVIQTRELIDEIDRKIKRALKIHSRATLPRAWTEKRIPDDKRPRFALWQRVLLPLLVRQSPGETDPRVRGGVNTVSSDPGYHTFFHAPCLILLLADRRAIGGVEYDLGICGQNMVLAAHSLGLGTCYVGLIDALRLYPRFRRERLGIVEPFRIVMSITLGYPKGRIDHPVRREQARIHWIS
jgi:nitroreductase/NAD-dependent dihydropyrimidine dehydrogenase PreA subunit